MARGIPARLSVKEGRKFGLTVGLAFGAVGGLVWWRGQEGLALAFWIVGGLLIAAGLVIPRRLGAVQRGWMRFALLISKVTTPIFMGIVYFLVLAPIGAGMRLLRHNPLTRQHGGDSIWVTRDNPRGDLERQI